MHEIVCMKNDSSEYIGKNDKTKYTRLMYYYFFEKCILNNLPEPVC
jgi:hypothetical protein